jgi:membrane protein implicated in regulation of membrane protease activity
MAVFFSLYLLYAVRRQQNSRGSRKSDDSDSLVGMVGKISTDINNVRTVKIGGKLWVARSAKPIPAGSFVRVIRCDGAVVFVKKVEKLTK